MKLLIAADIFPPQPGGPATYSRTLANELTKLGDEVFIVSLNPDSDLNAAMCKVEAVKYKGKLFKYVDYFKLLLKYSKNVDVIYAMGPVNAGLPALLVSKLRNRKLVVKVVGDYAWEQGVQRLGVDDSIDEFQDKKYKSLGVRFFKFIQSLVVKSSDMVIVPSNYLKKIVTGWGVKSEKVSVVYNTANLKDVRPTEKPAGEHWIVSAGRLVSWKGMDVLIKIMPGIIKKYPNVRLKIIGDGPELGNLKKEVDSLGLSGCVDLPGKLTHSELLSQLSKADVFVLNSGYEGLSHVMLEALKSGAPVLASRAGGNAELIIPGKNGDLFELNSSEEIRGKILAVLGDENKFVWAETEKNSFFEQFSLESMTKNTREVLSGACPVK